MYFSVMEFIDASENVLDVVLIDMNETTLAMLLDLFRYKMKKHGRIQATANNVSFQQPTRSSNRRSASRTATGSHRPLEDEPT